MTIITTISIGKELWDLAKIHNLSWTEAARVGAGVILADKGVKEYDGNLNLYRKMRYYQTELERMMDKISYLEGKDVAIPKK